MKKLILVLLSMIFIITLSACSVESAAEHEARIESEAQSIQNIQESASETVISETESTSTQSSASTTTSSSTNTTQTTTVASTPEVTYINVTLTVDCSNVIGKSNLSTTATIPSDGLMLNAKTITLPSGSTVYDALKYATAIPGYGITFTEDNSILNGYIISINNLYQKECGKYSGWMYKVNGTALPVGAKGAVLNNNDNIVWFYTTSTS